MQRSVESHVQSTSPEDIEHAHIIYCNVEEIRRASPIFSEPTIIVSNNNIRLTYAPKRLLKYNDTMRCNGWKSVSKDHHANSRQYIIIIYYVMLFR